MLSKCQEFSTNRNASSLRQCKGPAGVPDPSLVITIVLMQYCEPHGRPANHYERKDSTEISASVSAPAASSAICLLLLGNMISGLSCH